MKVVIKGYEWLTLFEKNAFISSESEMTVVQMRLQQPYIYFTNVHISLTLNSEEMICDSLMIIENLLLKVGQKNGL